MPLRDTRSALAAVQLCCDRAERGGRSRSPAGASLFGICGSPGTEPLSASRGCQRCCGTSLHGFGVTSSSHSSQCTFWETEPVPHGSEGRGRGLPAEDKLFATTSPSPSSPQGPPKQPPQSILGGTMGRARRVKRCTLPLHHPGRVLGPTALRSPVHRQDIPVGAESAPGWGGGSHRFLSQRWPKTSVEAP